MTRGAARRALLWVAFLVVAILAVADLSRSNSFLRDAWRGAQGDQPTRVEQVIERVLPQAAPRIRR